MENRGLLFIPDISGFTRFVTETEIGHSRLIIQELLEILINANQIGLEVSEIEGDAILFYRFGDPPALEDIYKQVEKMFCDFHQSLVAYDNRRYCQCKACNAAIGLTLKIVTHYGEFTGYNVKNFHKLIGKDIIVAHQLLKNDIEQHEYWLVTRSLVNDPPPSELEQWMKWDSSSKKTESGQIDFVYTQLSPLKDRIHPEPYIKLQLPRKTKMFSLAREYDTDLITLFHAAGDFNYRHLWKEGVIRIEELNHFLPRVGMRCRCIMDNGESVTYASSYSYKPDHIEFSETEEDKKSATYYTLERVSDSKTRLTIDYYIAKNMINEFMFRLTRKSKLISDFKNSLNKLDAVARSIHLPN